MNISQTSMEHNTPEETSVTSYNRGTYVLWRSAVSKLLKEKGYNKVAERWDMCNSSPRHIIKRNKPELPPGAESVWVCSESHEHDAVIFCPSCSFRVCPDCAPKQTARLIARYFPVISKQIALHPKYRLRKITLTRKIQLGDAGFADMAQDGFSLIQQAMRKVVGPNWNKNGAGLLVNWEVGENGLKLHYHAVYLGKWVDWKKLRDAWHELTGDSYIVYVQAVKRNDLDWKSAVMETLKYSTKFYKEDKTTGEQRYLSPELTVQLFEALKNTRRIRTYGSFFGIDTSDSDAFLCSECESPMKRISVQHWEIWVNTGFDENQWREMIREPLLQSRIANKSPPPRHIPGTGDRARTQQLPGFDAISIKGISHYDA
jgi:hypothetical protein